MLYIKKGLFYMNQNEQERRARLLSAAKKRLPSIKEQFEEAQKRNFNSNPSFELYR